MTLPNFNEYVVPGTYWEAISTPVAATALSTTPVVALIGPGIGYRTYIDAVTLTGTTDETLTQLGISTESVVVTSLDGSTVYSASSDYTVTSTPATDGHTLDTTTTIVRQSGSTIPSGATVSVSYQYTDNNYGAPSLVTSLQQVQALYGNSIDITTGDILSPLSYAAQFAITNGASQLVLVATPNATVVRDDLTAGYASISALNYVDLVVPLPVGLTGTYDSPGDVINVASDLSSFVDASASTSDTLQVGIVGYETSVTVYPDTISSTVGDKRVVEAWPNQMNAYNGYTNSTLTIAGYYLAAAYAGILAGNPPQQGLTRETIKGFTGISPAVFQTMTKAYKDQLSGSGVAVAEISRQGVLWCRHGTTTDVTSVYNREISLVRAQDAMVEQLEGSVEQTGLIGTPIDANTVVNIQALAIGVLSSLVDNGTIEGYTGVTATQLIDNPTIIQVTFQYQPSFPLNYITFVFSVNTQTGSVTAGTSTSASSSS